MKINKIYCLRCVALRCVFIFSQILSHCFPPNFISVSCDSQPHTILETGIHDFNLTCLLRDSQLFECWNTCELIVVHVLWYPRWQPGTKGQGRIPAPIIHVLATFQERTDLLCTRNPLKPNHNRLFIFLDWKIAYFFSTKINKYHLFFIFLIINNFYYYNFIILSYF